MTMTQWTQLFQGTSVAQVNMTKAMWSAVGAKDLGTAVQKLSECRDLDLRPLSAMELDMSLLQPMTQIVSLQLDGARLIHPECLGQLVHLESLSLMDCGLRNMDFLAHEMPNSFIESERGVTHPPNGARQLSNVPIPRFKKLLKLNLRNNSLGSLAFLKSLITLTWLDVGCNAFDDLGPIGQLTNLKNLGVQGNRIDNLEWISKLQNLTDLDLRHNGLRSVRLLGELRNLSRLQIAGNPLDCDDIEDLRRTIQVNF
jgi:internalin A